MARQPRNIIPGAPHHITQRGNRKQQVFFEDSDREFFLRTLESLAPSYGVKIFAYCLMTNHSHLGLIPRSSEELSNLMNSVHSKYATFINRRFGWSGHLWQQRFYSSPLDLSGLETVIGYIELNPVRAGLVISPEDYRWSSARSHLTDSIDPYLTLDNTLAMEIVGGRSWRETFFKERDYEKLRQLHCRNFPIGEEQFIVELEEKSGRQLSPRRRGPKVRLTSD